MKGLFRRAAAAILSLMMVLTFIPLLGGQQAFAGGGYDISGILMGGDTSGNVAVGQTVYVLESDLDYKLGTSVRAMVDGGELALCFTIGSGDSRRDEPAEYDSSTKRYFYKTKPEDAGKEIAFYTLAVTADTSYNNNTESLLVEELPVPEPAASASTKPYLTRSSVPNEDGSFTLSGYTPSSTFDRIVIENADGKSVDVITTEVSGKSSFSYLFEVSKYAEKPGPGYYYMTAYLNDDTKIGLSIYSESENAYYDTYFRVGIYEAPAIERNKDFFSAGSNYICFRPNFTVNTDLGSIFIRMQDTKTGEWGDIYGPFGSYEILKTNYFKGNKGDGGTKLKANRTYKVVALYGKEVKSRVGSGTAASYINGPYSSAVSVTTGKSAKPAVKSITAKVTKVKKKKLIQHAHWDVYGKWVPYKESYVTTTTYKVTVKLRKKPGAKGICIGDKRVKGNKLTYTATFTDSGKLKGKKITIGVCSYNDTALGAYSPTYKKKVKVK